MQEVCCRDCGHLLGWQDSAQEINWSYWKHNRCPVRLAKALDLSAEDYQAVLQSMTHLITAAYPDFPQMIEGQSPTAPEGWALHRAEIAAGMVLEGLAQSYALVPRKKKK
jgi:hypothetical protein